MTGGGRVVARALAVLPCLVVLLLVAIYAVDVPYWDTWDWLARHYPEQGEAGAWAMLQRYWAPFNDHRVFVPLLLDRALLSLSSIDILPRIYVKLPLSAAALLVTLHLVRRTVTGRNRAIAGVMVAALAFPLTYWPMWIDPRQFSIHIVVLAVVSAVAIATSRYSAGVRIIGAGALCTVASLSYAPGMFAWPFVGALLWRGSLARGRAALAVTWLALALVTVAPFVLDLQAGGHRADAVSPGVVSALDGAAAVAGLPVAPALAVAGYLPTRLIGAIGLLALVALAVASLRGTREQRDLAAPWLAIGAWAATYALAVGWTRAGEGLGALHDPRFAYLAMQLWIALVGLVAIVRPPVRWWSSTVPVMLVLLICLYGVASLRPFLAPGGIGRLSRQLTEGRACLLRYATADDRCLALLHPSAAHVRALAARLDAQEAAFLGPRRDRERRRDQR